MCFATEFGHLLHLYGITPFSSLLIGMCFATKLHQPTARVSHLDFQFPSHRDVLCDSGVCEPAPAPICFQFPSHRDVLCDFAVQLIDESTGTDFQFPSHRDVLCDPRTSYPSLILIRFFQFPSHRDVLCDVDSNVDTNGTGNFQFPSHRDVLCDSRIRIGNSGMSKAFSSLLIGMCFATMASFIITVGNIILSVPFSSGCALRR